MRTHGKRLTKFLSILTGATIATLIYIAQNGNILRHRSDRYAGHESLHANLIIDQMPDSDKLPQENSVHHQSSGSGDISSHKLTLFSITPNNSEMTFSVNPEFHSSTCSSSLQHKLRNDKWSAQYYHPAVRLIMNSGLMNEAEYQRLLPYSMPFGYKYKDPLTYEELSGILGLFSEEESIFDFSAEPRPPCLSCAVVGNGGILNGSGMGEEIDGHDMVFRVNHCIRRGHEKDVGTRTTHYVFMDRSLVHTREADIPKDKGIKWVFLPCRKNDYLYIAEVALGTNPKQKLKAKAQDIRILHPDFVRYVHKVWMRTKSFRPSTGAAMLMTALHAGCDQLSVYGMGFTKVYSEHYYDTKFIKYKNVKGSHDFAREIEIMKRLDKVGILRWYKRDVPEFN